jgi:isoprenylcysteine carboxyl methyltransferase (ICMT) family protein YpbQ
MTLRLLQFKCESCSAYVIVITECNIIGLLTYCLFFPYFAEFRVYISEVPIIAAFFCRSSRIKRLKRIWTIKTIICCARYNVDCVNSIENI